MKAYKLMRQRRDGSLGPLFINRKQVVELDKWLTAGDHPTKGYAHRPGWHCCLEPKAPHLVKSEDRVWVEVEVEDYKLYQRPASQGGKWVLANRMRVVQVL